MPGKKYKSIGIREKLYNTIEKEKKEGESISDYIDRIIDIAKGKEDMKEGLTKEILREVLKEVLGERKEQGNIPTTDANAGITKEDIKRIAAEMLLEIGMHIENGIAKGIKELR